MEYKIKNKNYNDETTDMALYDLLRDRGVTEPEKWLRPNFSYEHSPFLFVEMQKSIRMLEEVLKNPEASITVVVDSDVDGYTSGAIIIDLLKRVQRGQDINFVLHPGKEHGIVLSDLPDDVSLLIVPDAGSSQKEEHLKLLKNGTKIIILDHHEINNDMDYGEYKDNIAIVNSQEENYPNHFLSGAGVAMKFVQGYCSENGVAFPNRLYGLAACGIIADVMDIRVLENKQIITAGLTHIKEHAFLYKLITDAHYSLDNPDPTVKDIGWVIGPNINAIIRLGTMEQKHIIFKALVSPNLLISSSKRGEEGEEVPVFEEAVRLCKNAKKRQTTAVDKSIRLIENNLDIKSSDRSIIYVDEAQDLTFELSGLIANKLLSQYNRPVILLRHYTDGDIDEYRGSVRGKPVEGLANLKETMNGITGVDKAEGHAFAFGLGVEHNLLKEFSLHLNEALENVNYDVNSFEVDLVSDIKELNIPMAEIMSQDDIWGHGVDKPLAVVTNISTDNYELMGGEQQHLKINCGKLDVILFNVPDLTQTLMENNKVDLDVIGDFSIDSSYNVGRLQLVAKDFNVKPYTEKTVWDIIF